MLAAVSLTIEHIVIHDLMNLGLQRTVGTFQFIVFGLIAGWAYEALRLHERRRKEAESRLEEERRQAARLEQAAPAPLDVRGLDALFVFEEPEDLVEGRPALPAQ